MDAKYLLPIKFTDDLIVKSFMPNLADYHYHYPQNFHLENFKICFTNTIPNIFLCVIIGKIFGSQIWIEELSGPWPKNYRDGYDEFHLRKQLKKCLDRIEEKWLVKRFTNFSK